MLIFLFIRIGFEVFWEENFLVFYFFWMWFCRLARGGKWDLLWVWFGRFFLGVLGVSLSLGRGR